MIEKTTYWLVLRFNPTA